MKTFAHRGWAAGEIENTLAGFEKSAKAGFDGVEFDVRFSPDGRTVILSHDAVGGSGAGLTLGEALTYLQSSDMELLIEFKEYSDKLFELVIEHLQQHYLLSKVAIFAFPEVAALFPWTNRRGVKLGIIAPYPQDVEKYVRLYYPDMVLMGWGTKKERLLFKIVWSVVSLKKIFKKYANVKFVIGVAYSEKDKTWLSKQSGLYGFTGDMPLV